MKVSRRRAYAIVTAVLLIAFAICAVLLIRPFAGRRESEILQNARSLYEAGDYENALLLLRRVEDTEHSAEIALLMADCYEAMGKPDFALAVLRELNTSDQAIAGRIYLLEEKRQNLTEAGTLSIAGQVLDRYASSASFDDMEINEGELRQISSLYSLNTLSLRDNQLTDIRLIASLGGLDELDLAGNLIKDLGPISGLKELKTLNLAGNPVSDLSPLETLSKLSTLRVTATPVSNEQIKHFSEILPCCAIIFDTEEGERIRLGQISFSIDVKELNLTGSGLSDLSALSECVLLEKLDVSRNEISDLTPLMAMAGLRKLGLGGNSVSDLRPLIGLKSLKELDASDNQIEECRSVGAISGLTQLTLNGNPLRDLNGLGKLTELESLEIRGCGVTDDQLMELCSLQKLLRLDLMSNEGLSNQAVGALQTKIPGCIISTAGLVYEIDFCGHQVRSDEKRLAFPGGDISVISGLEGLVCLEELDLSGNRLIGLYPFVNCPCRNTLRRLNLSDNDIRDLSSISDLLALEELDLSNNQIDSTLWLMGMTWLKRLSLSGNPISEEQLIQLGEALPGCEIIF